MAKRFRDTNIWDEDWYLSLGGGGMLFWDYICDHCDFVGVWRPNFVRFERSTGHRINPQDWLNKANVDKERVRILGSGRWMLTQFVAFQYSGGKLSNKVGVHRSIVSALRVHCVSLESIGCTIWEGHEGDMGGTWGGHGPKDKEKDNDGISNSLIDSLGKNENPFATSPQSYGQQLPDVPAVAYDLDYLRVVSAYPATRVPSKLIGARAWAKLIASGANGKATADAICTALEWQTKSYDWNKRGGEYIPTLSRYLEERRWEAPKPQ